MKIIECALALDKQAPDCKHLRGLNVRIDKDNILSTCICINRDECCNKREKDI